MSRIALTLTLSLIVCGPLFAHEGHGHSASGQGNSLWHYLSEPQHAWVFAAALSIAAASMLWRNLRREIEQPSS